MPIAIACIVCLVVYVIGSISFAYLAGRSKGIDLREHGSGNIGATNAGRVLGKGWFFLVFSLDVCKGMLPVLVMRYWAINWTDWSSASTLLELMPLLAGIAAVLGHSFTCFHGFKGGKAVATSLGVVIALAPIVAAMAFGVWVFIWLLVSAIWKLKRSDAVGPASICAAFGCPIIHFSYHSNTLSMPMLPTSILLLLLSVLILFRHRSNARKFLDAIKTTKKEDPVI